MILGPDAGFSGEVLGPHGDYITVILGRMVDLVVILGPQGDFTGVWGRDFIR